MENESKGQDCINLTKELNVLCHLNYDMNMNIIIIHMRINTDYHQTKSKTFQDFQYKIEDYKIHERKGS